MTWTYTRLVIDRKRVYLTALTLKNLLLDLWLGLSWLRSNPDNIYFAEITCAYPGVPPRGSIFPSRTSYSIAEVVEFSCDRGYVLVGDRTSTCGRNGDFDSGVPKCESKKLRDNCRNARCGRLFLFSLKSTQRQMVWFFETTLLRTYKRHCGQIRLWLRWKSTTRRIL